MIAQGFHYPKAPQDNTVDTYFGTQIADPYRPLEDDNSAETERWVTAENALTRHYLDQLPQRPKLMKRLKELANYEKVGTPFKRHGTWYVYKNNGLQNQSVLYKMDKLGGTLHEVLDPNKLSSDGTVALKSISFSHNGRYMAYIVSRNGSDWQEIYVKDLETGQDLTDHIEWAKFSNASWRGNGFYYSAYDAPTGHTFTSKNEVHKIYYHKLGTPQNEDELFYQNPAFPLRFYDVMVNKEETVMYLTESGEGSGNNLFVRDLRRPDTQFVQMTNDMNCQYALVQTVGDSIYIFTNAGAQKNRLMLANLANPGIKDWKELVPEAQHVLDDVTFTNGKMVLSYSKDASSHCYLYSLDGRNLGEIKLPSVGSASFSGERNEPECFFSFSSFTVPGTVYQFDTDSRTSRVYSQPKVNFKPNDFVTKQVFYASKDGTRVPMFLTYRKDLKLNGKNPVYLYGYGGFNVALPPYFSSMRIPFMEQGGIYVQVNLRGGSEYGEAWHKAGTKMQKQNVFDDFIAAAEWLIANKYTDKKHLAIVGGSNGGLLVGACLTQRPDLFQVCIPQVGVLDMLRYHRFTIGWNWAPDYGTSADSKEMFDYLRGYSPLHNLKKGMSYPATLITTADHDDRVVPAHSFKFAATMQECQGGKAPVLIRIDSKAGHGGGKPLSKQIEEQADIYSFILANMGK
ncbi:MAG: S9 family peptidase [Prevotella oris]|nr:S9 family peptidase [Segatella oris]